MAGQILGDRYEVQQQLGKQSGRWTLLAQDLTTEQQVVIKVLFMDDDLNPEDLRLFEREVEVLKSLSHPCIPPYLNYFEQELPMSRVIALVQAFVPGKSLQHHLNRCRTFTEADARQFAMVMLKILQYLHSHNPPVIHRDIKPSSIVMYDRRPHLVDFGAVKLKNSQESSAFTMVGTYGYIPPEQFSGRAVLASDLYGLGATLIAMLTGKDPNSLPRKNGQFDLDAVVDLSPDLVDWLQWMTESSLDRRLQSVAEALQVLEARKTRRLL
ncbi:MAG: serine/threonine-protein kinase [Synechococcales bacterium]|nr:serine/threonine-protein kinase [Synechococcales bacterium]